MLRTRPASAAVHRVFAGTRPAILLVGYLAVLLVGYPEGANPWRTSANEFVNLQARWDAGWYLGVAIQGYAGDPGRRPGDQQNIVFFPAYPLLTRAAGRLLGGLRRRSSPCWAAHWSPLARSSGPSRLSVSLRTRCAGRRRPSGRQPCGCLPPTHSLFFSARRRIPNRCIYSAS